MFRIIAITLDEKRMIEMKKIWPGVETFHGLKSTKPYAGCNLSHIAAIREGLKNGESHVLILEDDCRPKESAEVVYATCSEAMKHSGWDILSLCAASDFNVIQKPVVARQFLKGIYAFEASRQFVNADAVLWSRSALPLIDEYESLLKINNTFLPIDLMFYNNYWSYDIVGSEPCQLKYHLHEMNGKKFWPPSLTWNHPRTLIAWPPLTYQSTDYISLQTGKSTPDYSESNLKLQVHLHIDSIPEKLSNKLDFVIGTSVEVNENETTECG